MTGSALLVLLVLGTYMDADGTNGRASQETLATATGLSKRSVRQYLADAVESGWLDLVSRGHRRGDGSTVTSCYRASQPATDRHLTEPSSGDGLPPEDYLYRRDGASQAARSDTSSGDQSPPTKTIDQKETRAVPIVGPSKPAPIDPDAQKAAGAGLGALRAVLRPEGDAA